MVHYSSLEYLAGIVAHPTLFEPLLGTTAVLSLMSWPHCVSVNDEHQTTLLRVTRFDSEIPYKLCFFGLLPAVGGLSEDEMCFLSFRVFMGLP